MEKNITKKLCSILLSFAIVLTSVCIPSVSVSAANSLAEFYLTATDSKLVEDTDYKHTQIYWNGKRYDTYGSESATVSDYNKPVKVTAGTSESIAFVAKGANENVSSAQVTVKLNLKSSEGTDSTKGGTKVLYTTGTTSDTEWSAVGENGKYVYTWTADSDYVVQGWSLLWSNNTDGTPSITVTIDAYIPVKSVTLTGNVTSAMKPGAEVQLTAVVSPSNAYNKNVIWSTDSESIASVTNGLVKAEFPGNATVTVTAEDTGWVGENTPATDTRAVHVDYQAVTGITASATKTTLYMNPLWYNDPTNPYWYVNQNDGYAQMSAVVSPNASADGVDATYNSVTYSIADADNKPDETGDTVATVTENGYVAATAPGKTKVTATTGNVLIDGDVHTATVDFEVKVHTEGVKFVDNKGEDTETDKTELAIYEGETIDLAQYIKVLGYTTKDGKYYNASNEEVELKFETASQDGGTVDIKGTEAKGVNYGKGTITVKTKDRDWTDTLNVTVYKTTDGVDLSKESADADLWYNGKDEEKTMNINASPYALYGTSKIKAFVGYESIEWKIKSYVDSDGNDLSEYVSIAKQKTGEGDNETINDLVGVLSLKKGAKAGVVKVEVTVKNHSSGSFTPDKSEVTATIAIDVKGYVEKLELPENATIYKNCDKEDHTIDLGDELVLTPSDAYNTKVTWESSDPSVATVDNDGVVTAVGYGTATITATSVGKNKDGKTVTSNECEVHVQLHPESIDITGEKNDITGETSTIYINSTKESFTKTKLTATITPENASYTDKKVEWVVADADKDMVTITTDENDSTIAYVTSNAKKTGTAKITAKVTYLENGKEKVTVESEPYTVYVEKLVESITTENGDRTNDITIYTNAKNDADKKAEIEAIVNPDDAYVKSLDEVFGPNGGFYIWKASGSTASISLVKDTDNLNKATIKALAPGKLEIYAKAKGVTTSYPSDLFAKWNVNVVELVEGIELNKATTSIQEGSNETLVATIKNETASDKSVTWTSSDPSIATVDASGKVVAKKTGTVTITATANDKYDPDGTIGGYNKVATCKVTVTAKPAETKVVTCEEANGKGWVWSEAKKACVYKVTNTSAE